MARLIEREDGLILSLEEGTREFVQLHRRVTEEGILKRDYGFYALDILATFAGLAFFGYFLLNASSTFLFIILTIGYTLIASRLGGLVHDVGHMVIFKRRVLNQIAGVIFGVLLGMNVFGWMHKHNLHHGNPNQEEKDPDIDQLFSFTIKRYQSRAGLERLIARYQYLLFLPLAFNFLAYGLHFERNIKYVVAEYKQPKLSSMFFFQCVISAVSLFWMYVVPFIVFTPLHALLFIMLFNLIMGIYLTCVFSPGHMGMPEIQKDVSISFLEMQIITSRNINSSSLIDFIYWGLNYQIEHHLFPKCPRNKLKLIAPHVKSLCARLNLPYASVAPLESIKDILNELKSVVKEAEKYSTQR